MGKREEGKGEGKEEREGKGEKEGKCSVITVLYGRGIKGRKGGSEGKNVVEIFSFLSYFLSFFLSLFSPHLKASLCGCF